MEEFLSKKVHICCFRVNPDPDSIPTFSNFLSDRARSRIPTQSRSRLNPDFFQFFVGPGPESDPDSNPDAGSRQIPTGPGPEPISNSNFLSINFDFLRLYLEFLNLNFDF